MTIAHRLIFVVACGTALAGVIGTARAGTYTQIYAFADSTDGSGPMTGLIDVGGMLYGTTFGGGAAGKGTIFSLDPATGIETVLYGFQNFSHGKVVEAGLAHIGNKLYGTTYSGGRDDVGTVFSYDLKTNTSRVIHAFLAGKDGAYPQANMINVDGTLYGTTVGGGSANYTGTVFSLDSVTRAEKVLYAFQGGSDGGDPESGLINVGGILYGTASNGGAANRGVVYSIDPTTGTEKTLYAFQSGTDGAYPLASLIYQDGAFYGTTIQGGTAGYGTVFSVDLATGSEKVLYSFQGTNDGTYPQASVTKIGDMIYGTTNTGGNGSCDIADASGCGTVFSLNLATGMETVVHAFQGGSDGSAPYSSLINLGGTLYGTTFTGGSKDNGTIFTYRP